LQASRLLASPCYPETRSRFGSEYHVGRSIRMAGFVTDAFGVTNSRLNRIG
jgi:hypothetical protein